MGEATSAKNFNYNIERDATTWKTKVCMRSYWNDT